MSETAQVKATHASPQQRELPSGWRWVRLEEVTSVVNGTTPDSENPCFWNGDIVWITPTDLGKLAEPYIRNSDRKITKAGFDSRNLTRVPSRSVVLSSRAPIGHLGIAAIELCTNQGCKSFIPNDDIHEWFLYYSLKRSVWKFQQLGSGATFAEISKTQLENFIIPLPPIEEQRRIARVLREQMEVVEKARRAAQARLAAVKVLPAAFLRQIFPQPGQPLPNGWCWIRLGKVCRFINGDAYKESDWNTEGIPIIRIQNLNDKDKPFNYWSGALEDRVRVDDGDLLLAWSGTPGTSFGAHIWNRGVGVLNQHIFLVQTNNALEKVYAKWAINETIDDLIKAAHGAVGLAHVTKREVEALLIPLPPLPEQLRIAGVLREQMAAVESARASVEAELNSINTLPAALLRRAFNGEL
jgi:type I restriction enzyme S subunit